MMPTNKRRLLKLEQWLGRRLHGPTIIVVSGGIHAYEPMFASAGQLKWLRANDESLGDFKARVTVAASEAREKFIVIQGSATEG